MRWISTARNGCYVLCGSSVFLQRLMIRPKTTLVVYQTRTSSIDCVWLAPVAQCVDWVRNDVCEVCLDWCEVVNLDLGSPRLTVTVT